MTNLVLTRHFPVSPEKVFEFVTNPEHLLKWWGPEGMFVPEGDLDLSRLGPWSSVMENKDGGRYKVTGEVIGINPPQSVEFTWAWHDDQDVRGTESVVKFNVELNSEGGSTFTLTQIFPTEEDVGNHDIGWTSSLRKLEALAS